ncbi:MAG: YkgJ family cysteine cluster protein [Deltaproteobacteria bacterium]|nr:YkgJ family cysteine cluster protein [Deltaproteobacteria bacterium]MBW1921397.1 YkgJ family cysteine cluster protein [Deltaproteobacteria bacterium]MBW1934571.1 YkgJ family cysteine cluster protein [Deltaproteobacteria bacterium]MBW1977715.1 YkgJ family cysteine cluster protein [Deltaproteobacteria bacterium]MBW2043429.1 YkgJ family cysteine cluster protein [Deltaproteobacteria bacterium]
MNPTQFFRSYEFLVDRADAFFAKMEKGYGSCINCKRHCSDCCQAVFGLFLIESAYIKSRFDQLDPDTRKQAILRCNEADRGLKRLETKLEINNGDPEAQSSIMAKERIRCPLLDDNEDCILYTNRPITCRVYGAPTRIHGKVRACSRSGFKAGERYPVFDLDGTYRELYLLSREFLSTAGDADPEKASLLISVSKAIRTPLEELVYEIFRRG